MKKLVLFTLIFCFFRSEIKSSEFTIVFVHIGEALPDYLDWALIQARLFNDCKIVLIANEQPLDRYQSFLKDHNITGVSCESLQKTVHHKEFIKHSPLDRNFRGGFWYLASERFFYLDDF